MLFRAEIAVKTSKTEALFVRKHSHVINTASVSEWPVANSKEIKTFSLIASIVARKSILPIRYSLGVPNIYINTETAAEWDE